MNQLIWVKKESFLNLVSTLWDFLKEWKGFQIKGEDALPLLI